MPKKESYKAKLARSAKATQYVFQMGKVDRKVGVYTDMLGTVQEAKSKKMKKAVVKGYKGYW